MLVAESTSADPVDGLDLALYVIDFRFTLKTPRFFRTRVVLLPASFLFSRTAHLVRAFHTPTIYGPSSLDLYNVLLTFKCRSKQI